MVYRVATLPLVTPYPLEKAAEAYAHMLRGKRVIPRRSDDVKVEAAHENLKHGRR